YVEGAWKALGEGQSPKHAYGKLLRQIDARTGVLTGDGSRVQNVLGLLSEDDCVLPAATVRGAVLKAKDAEGAYVSALQRNRSDVHVYTREAERRNAEDDVDGAVRALSGVIEEYPARG